VANRLYGGDRRVDPHEDVVELLEELDEIERKLTLPRFAQVTSSEPRPLAPSVDGVKRKELVGMIEDGKKELVGLVWRSGPARRRDRIGDARRTGKISRELVHEAWQVQAVEALETAEFGAHQIDDDVFELVEGTVADEIGHPSHRQDENTAALAVGKMDPRLPRESSKRREPHVTEKPWRP
jgi:hypothetical protein